MSAACKQESCTVGETGVCLLNNDPATCPNRLSPGAEVLDVAAEISPPLSTPKKNPRFPQSQTLSHEQAAAITGERYCRLIGILGSPDAGKTAALVSLYLLLARDKLDGVRFADSRTLMAFDEISHGARRWNDGNLPDQLTAHTEMADDRGAGFLHLRLVPDGADPVDLLLPDLPGEWTDAMVDKGRVDRLQFLLGADLIWLMVDGRQLSTPQTRQFALHRTKLMLQRLAKLVPTSPPIFLVVTRRDTGRISEGGIAELMSEATACGLRMEIMEIASFADAGEVRPGEGIAALVNASIRIAEKPPAFWPAELHSDRPLRAMMRFKKDGAA